MPPLCAGRSGLVGYHVVSEGAPIVCLLTVGLCFTEVPLLHFWDLFAQPSAPI